MKKLLILLTSLAVAMTVTVSAAEKKELTDDQKKVVKALLEKYDENKDGKLSKEEKAKMTPDDKAKWDEIYPRKKKKDA